MTPLLSRVIRPAIAIALIASIAGSDVAHAVPLSAIAASVTSRSAPST